MSRLALGFALFSLVAAFPAWAQAPKKGPAASERFLPYDLKVDTLENGLTVVRVPYPSPGLVAYYTVVRVGSRNEVEKGHTGFAHFFEHMMFKGTPTRPEGEREKIMGRAGFNDNAYTTDDFTVYHSYGPSSALGELIEIEADRFQNLTYSEPSFQTEAKAVLGEYHKSAARPDLHLEEALLATGFSKHTYRHTTLGYYEDIKKMPEYYEYSKQFFERWYTPDNTVLVIVGDIDDAALMERIRKSYGTWKGKSAKVAIPTEPPQRGLQATRVEWKGQALPRQMLAWRTPAARLDRKDAAVQEVLSAYLMGPTSELHKELVLEKQLVEQMGSWFYPHRDPYLFTLDAHIKDEKNRAAVMAAINKKLRALVTGRVDKARVEAIKSNLRYSFLMGLETPNQVAGQLAWYIGIFGAPNALERHYANIRSVTPNDLLTFAREYLTALNRIEVQLVNVAPDPSDAKATQKQKENAQ